MKEKQIWLKRALCYALPCALLLLLLSPSVALAHATLVRSDPQKDAVLNASPSAVRLWFSEDLNPLLSKAVVIDSNNQRVDNEDSRVANTDQRELQVKLKPNLIPGTYLVLYQTGSANDGHTLRGSFLFYIANEDGSVPAGQAITAPPDDLLGGGHVSGTSLFEIPTLLLFSAVTLLELGAVFWVGAYLWYAFVVLRAQRNTANPTVPITNLITRFERHFALPILIVMLVANILILANQALGAVNGSWFNALNPLLLWSIALSSRFGIFVLLRELFILLALALLLYQRFAKQPIQSTTFAPLANLVLGLALLFAMSMSSHASAVTDNQFLAIISDLFHLLGSALWIGGMLFIAAVYLEEIKIYPILERARSMTTVLPRYSPLALAGVGLLLLTGPLNTTFHLTTPAQLLTTSYGRALLVKIIIVVILLIISTVHAFSLRPRLKKELHKYTHAHKRLHAMLAQQHQESTDEPTQTIPNPNNKREKLLAQQVQLREQRVTSRTRQLTSILRWEPVLGVSVLLAVGLMNIFASSLVPVTAQGVESKPVNTVVKTEDGRYNLNINITPNRFGVNTFTVRVTDTNTSQPATDVSVVLYTNMLEMDMGTDSTNLQSTAPGTYNAEGTLNMAGRWQGRVVVRSPDNKLHTAKIEFRTGF